MGIPADLLDRLFKNRSAKLMHLQHVNLAVLDLDWPSANASSSGMGGRNLGIDQK